MSKKRIPETEGGSIETVQSEGKRKDWGEGAGRGEPEDNSKKFWHTL